MLQLHKDLGSGISSHPVQLFRFVPRVSTLCIDIEGDCEDRVKRRGECKGNREGLGRETVIEGEAREGWGGDGGSKRQRGRR